MHPDRHKIVVTGGAGFIASCLVETLNLRYPEKEILSVDDFTPIVKQPNHNHLSKDKKLERSRFPDQSGIDPKTVEAVFHLGARTDTAERVWEIFQMLNLDYSKKVWEWCTDHDIPLIYASSAATYGDGTMGYEDRHEIVPHLHPLNPYGVSKNEFDKWALQRTTHPPHWYGVKFFNVYGPNEYHKGRMASVVFHAYNQIGTTKKMNLFMSHREGIEHGHQSRDFIYVKDVVKMCLFLFEQLPPSGLYNIGTGQARSFLDLVGAVFKAMNIENNIAFIPTPEDIRDNYQYFTEAKMNKLQQVGYPVDSAYSLEEGISDYVQNYLMTSKKRF